MIERQVTDFVRVPDHEARNADAKATAVVQPWLRVARRSRPRHDSHLAGVAGQREHEPAVVAGDRLDRTTVCEQTQRRVVRGRQLRQRPPERFGPIRQALPYRPGTGRIRSQRARKNAPPASDGDRRPRDRDTSVVAGRRQRRSRGCRCRDRSRQAALRRGRWRVSRAPNDSSRRRPDRTLAV